jgi:hypothetical protein
MQTLLPYLSAFLSFVGAASVLAKLLASFLPAMKEHAYSSSWKAETGLYEAYATAITGLCHVLDGMLWAAKKAGLNVATKPTIVVNGKVLP